MNKEANASINSTKKKIIIEKTEKSQIPKIMNETVDKADKLKFISVNKVSNKITQIEKPSEINIHRNNLDISVFFWIRRKFSKCNTRSN